MSLSLRLFFFEGAVKALEGAALQLREAVLGNRSAEVHALLDQGLAVDTRLSATETPLTLALLNRHWSLAEELLERGADPDQKVNRYCTCLSWAGMHQQSGLVEKLLQRTARIDEQDSQGTTPLWWAVRLGLKADVDRLLASGARGDRKDRVGNSLLHLAALGSNVAIVEKLIRVHPGLCKAGNSYQKQTPLHVAAINTHGDSAKMVELLLAAGAAPDRTDVLGQTPLVLAAAMNSPSVLNAMLATGAKFSPAHRALALKIAIAGNHQENVARLMANFDLSSPLDESHPLRAAVTLNRWPMVDQILKNGISPDSRMPDGEALLAWSIQQFLPELAKILLKAGATLGCEQAFAWLDNVMMMRKVGKIALAPGSRPESEPLEARLLVALQKNIEKLGFVLSPELAERVLTLTTDELRAFHDLLVSCLRVMVGAHVIYKPMYPNFPDQVREASPAELYFNAALHYWGDLVGRRFLPNYSKDPRPGLKDKAPLKSVGLAEPDEASKLFRRLLEARGSLRPEDKEALTWLVYSRANSLSPDLPGEVPFRENAAILATALLRFTDLHSEAISYVTTGLDVLRTASAFSGGDVSLATNTRFSSFPKSLRRWFLARLEADSNIDESLWRHPEKFKRLAERLHPGEYRKRFPKTWDAFGRLRSSDKPATFGGWLEGYLSQADVEASLALLLARPGEFARRLDHLLRLAGPHEAETVLTAFAKVAPRLPSPLLLQLRKHFQSRPMRTRLRVVFPKGDLAKVKAIDNELAPLDPALCSRIEKLCRETLMALYAQRPPLGTCWLDERLRNYNVPFALRSASKSLHTVARGSRIPFVQDGEEEAASGAETMRFFIWWRDGKSRTDLDLSALVLDGDFAYQTTLAYYNLKEFGGYHSGDITSAPHGASEFIDIEIPTFLGRGSRYVMMVVNSFTTQPYCDLPECFAGFMHRARPQSGEIYEPRTVVNKFDLTANTTIAIPLILDLHQREVIWTDLSLKRNPSTVNNVHGNRSSLSLLCEAMVSLNKPSLHDLFELHIAARGQAVPQRDQARTLFSSEAADGAVTPYDIPLILSDYL